MRKFIDLPIRSKMLAIIAIASVGALLITGVATLTYELTSFRPKAEEALRAGVEVIHANVRAAVSFHDEAAATEDLQSLDSMVEIRAAAIYDPQGKIFASYTRKGAEGFRFPALARKPAPRFQRGYLTLWKPIATEDEVIGHLFVQRDLPPLYARLPQYGLMFAAVAVALVSASLLLMAAMRRMILAPILDLSRAAQAVRDRSDFGVRVRSHGTDEIGALTEAFNEMLGALDQREADLRRADREQQALQEQLAQAQKMESIGRLAGGIAHDFNNLLTVVSGSAELAQYDLPPDSRAAGLIGDIRKASNQAADLTRQLLAFARKQVIEPKIVDPNRLIRDSQGMLRSLLKEDIELEMLTEAQPWFVRVDPNQLTRVLMNLAANARDAMPAQGKLTIETRNVRIDEGMLREVPEMHPGEYVTIRVTDTGEGITDATRRHMFEPFFTTKDKGKGTGLGLAMCYGIVKQSGGHILATSLAAQGTTFTVYLERCAAADDRPEAGTQPEQASSGGETVLVVEDNAMVRSTTIGLLRSQGYRTLEAEGGPDALGLVETLSEPVHLLITDVVMPVMSGREVAQRLKNRLPGLKVLYISGYAANELDARKVERDGDSFLQKPYTSGSLRDHVRTLLDT